MPSENEVVAILKTVKDSVLPVNVWDLGLIYELNISENDIKIVMSLTSEVEPSHAEVPKQIKQKLEEGFPGFQVDIKLVFEPQWTPEKMNQDAQDALGIRDA